MIRRFDIEYPDGLGPEWMNKDNLTLCIQGYCKGIEVTVYDVVIRQEPSPGLPKEEPPDE